MKPQLIFLAQKVQIGLMTYRRMTTKKQRDFVFENSKFLYDALNDLVSKEEQNS